MTVSNDQKVDDLVMEFSTKILAYEAFARAIEKEFKKIAPSIAPLAFINTRVKTIPSLAEKIIRKDCKYKNLEAITDLVGGRVIVDLQTELHKYCQFIENNFVIDWENSVDVGQRLKPAEFGYRSVHYVIQMDQEKFPGYPPEIYFLKAEIQVRTTLEHAWASFAHDRIYKAGYSTPDQINRKLAGIAAMLEDAGQGFTEIEKNLHTYTASYGTSMSVQKINNEINLQKTILKYNPENPAIADRIGLLYIQLGEWQKAIDAMTPFVSTRHPSLLRDLGLACSRLYKKAPEPGSNNGQEHLISALEYILAGENGDPKLRDLFLEFLTSSNDSADLTKRLKEACSHSNGGEAEVLVYLAGTLDNAENALVLLRQAFELEKDNSYVLDHYLDGEILVQRSLEILNPLKAVLEVAVEHDHKQADLGTNLPWAFLNLGKFYMWLEKPLESLAAYALAIHLNPEVWMLQSSLQSLEKLKNIVKNISGFDSNLALLKTGIKLLSQPPESATNEPVTILTGACDKSGICSETEAIFVEAFKDYEGRIYCAGLHKILPLVVKIGKKPGSRRIAFAPAPYQNIPINPAPDEIRYTTGREFGLLETVEMWHDLISQGIKPSQVKLIAVDGDKMTLVELKIALALGAKVAFLDIKNSELYKLRNDRNWEHFNNLITLPLDIYTIKLFLQVPFPVFQPLEIREKLAHFIHQAYQEEKKSNSDPAMHDWDELLDYLQESNRKQADHYIEKLARINCGVKVLQAGDEVLKFSDDEIENLSYLEHSRWMVERYIDSWQYGKERDVSRKTTPYLAPWSTLPEHVKNIDRSSVIRIPENLAKVGLLVYRL